MYRRELIAIGATKAVCSFVSTPVSGRPPDFLFDDFETVTDVEVDGEEGVFVGGGPRTDSLESSS